jgi:hypothetical protein
MSEVKRYDFGIEIEGYYSHTPPPGHGPARK